jgi:hypothetical protein
MVRPPVGVVDSLIIAEKEKKYKKQCKKHGELRNTIWFN